MTEFVHPFRRSVFRGVKHRCPACGQGKLYRAYLKVNDTCPICETDLAQYPADDGPAYLTILIVGHLIVAPLLFFPIVWRSDWRLSLPLILIPLTTLVLLLLPRVKGGWIGLMYALGVKRDDAHMHTADAAD
jgi:uncharacterized protein (DUF983 family)